MLINSNSESYSRVDKCEIQLRTIRRDYTSFDVIKYTKYLKRSIGLANMGFQYKHFFIDDICVSFTLEMIDDICVSFTLEMIMYSVSMIFYELVYFSYEKNKLCISLSSDNLLYWHHLYNCIRGFFAFWITVSRFSLVNKEVSSMNNLQQLCRNHLDTINNNDPNTERWGTPHVTPPSADRTPFTIIMMTSSNGNIFRVTGPLCGEFTGPGEFPAQRPVTRSFDGFVDLRPNKRLSKQPWGWWFETPSWSLWCHCNDIFFCKSTMASRRHLLAP